MAPRTSLACILTGPSRSAPDSDFIFLDGTLNQVVQAVVKFRDSHVNRRSEYFCDEMLDELLKEIESMDTVIFYWLKGHSGAVPNEAADFQATALLEEEPMDVGQRPVRRHASLTFAFDRRPFAWAAERATRHIQAVRARAPTHTRNDSRRNPGKRVRGGGP